MAKSERAKALEAKQKAELKAAKEAKKNSTDPKDWGTIKQIREGFRVTSQVDSKLVPITIVALLVPIVLAVALCLTLQFTVGLSWLNWILIVVTGVMLGVLLALFLFNRRAEKATFARYAGQAGSGEVALQMLPKTWTRTPAIAFNKHRDVIHRALGPGGLVLIGEGEPGRVRQMLATEVKKHEAALFDIEAQTVMMGDREGQIPLADLPKHLRKLPKKLDKAQIAEAGQRLAALDAVRQRMPIPKGPMPNMRGARKAMRGR